MADGGSEDPLASVDPWPAPLDAESLPQALRDNPIVRAYLAMSPAEHRLLAKSAESDAEDDDAVAAALVASVR